MQTAIGTATGAGMMQAANGRLPDGAFTSTIYGLIRDGKFNECIRHLELELAVRLNRWKRAVWSVFSSDVFRAVLLQPVTRLVSLPVCKFLRGGRGIQKDQG